MEGDARDARRKRIMERGSDRLAFITGESKSLPVPSSPPPPRTPTMKEAASFIPAAAIAENDDENETTLKSETSPGGEPTEEDFPRCKLGKEFPKRGSNNETTVDAQTSHEVKELTKISTACGPPDQVVHLTPSTTARGPPDQVVHLTPSTTARGPPDQVVHAARSTTPLMNHQILTPQAVSRAISATENIRVLCAITIALLVVLSSYGYSLVGSILSCVISFRPLFLVLLTDVTIVLGLVVSTEGSDRNEDDSRAVQGDRGLDNVGMALEAAMLLQKASRAAFMDCSICAVIMICGFAG